MRLGGKAFRMFFDHGLSRKHTSHVYIDMQDVYDKEFVARIHRLPSASLSEVFSGTSHHAEVKLQYQNKKDFESIAKRLKIMSDLRVNMDYSFCIML